MKRRLLSLLLAIAVIAVSVSAAFPTLTMADTGSQSVVDGDIDVDMSESDPIAIVRAGSSNYDYGFVSPVNGQYVYAEGDNVTFVAVPLASNNFVGWFKEGEDQPVSDSLVFTYPYNSDDDSVYYAKFEKGTPSVLNAGFEGYNVGAMLANQNPVTVGDKTEYKDPIRVDGWNLDSAEDGGVVKGKFLQVTNQQAHTGEKSLLVSARYAYAGIDITGLEKNTEYVISFYTYMSSGTTMDQRLAKAFIVPKDTDVAGVKEKDGTKWSFVLDESLGYMETAFTTVDKWQKITFAFNTNDNTDVALWLNYTGGTGSFYIDNLGVAKGSACDLTVTAGLGGSVSASDSGLLPQGTVVVLDATTNEGNTFIGWFKEGEEEPFSNKQNNFEYTVTEDESITARFEGYNKPSREYFTLKGEDGTFENGTISGWYAASNEYDNHGWCQWPVSQEFVSEGEKALKVAARFRTSVLPITGLSPNTDYKLCFDYIHPNEYDLIRSNVQYFGIISPETFVPSNAAIEYAVDTRLTPAGLGWQRVEMYFNTGDANAVNFVFKYFANDISNSVHIDNMFLYEYVSQEELINADFTNGTTAWIGNGKAATDNENGVLQLGENDSAYQLFEMDTQSLYTVKFRAKGNVTAAVSDINANTANAKTALTSQSIITTDSTDWEDYEIQVYSNIHPDAALVFTGLGSNSFVDDIVITKESDSQNAIVEKIDFENGRYDVPSSVNSDAYEIYTATAEGDANVHSGLGSLKFKYTEADSVVENIFDAAYLCTPSRKGISYKLSINYKIAGGRLGGSFFAQPDTEGLFLGNAESEHSADNDGWNEIAYFFTNSSDVQIFKTYLSNAIYNTLSDVYIDDITLTISPPVVVETDSRVAYCEGHYNMVLNGNFEDAVSNKNWANLPTTIKVVKNKSKALKGSHYMTVSAGTKYILPIEASPSAMSYFAVSVRANSKAKGSISLADSIDPIVLYNDTNDKPASIINVTNTGSKWERSSFKFSTGSTGIVYLVIECTAGSFDLDSLMLFKEEFGYRYDPNDYTVYKPYDYEATKSSTVVVNGGFGKQPYYSEGDGPSAGTPDTGDVATLPMVILLVTVLACSVVLVSRKRKAGASANA